MKTNRKFLVVFLCATAFTAHLKTEHSASSIQSLEKKNKQLPIT